MATENTYKEMRKPNVQETTGKWYYCIALLELIFHSWCKFPTATVNYEPHRKTFILVFFFRLFFCFAYVYVMCIRGSVCEYRCFGLWLLRYCPTTTKLYCGTFCPWIYSLFHWLFARTIWRIIKFQWLLNPSWKLDMRMGTENYQVLRKEKRRTAKTVPLHSVIILVPHKTSWNVTLAM